MSKNWLKFLVLKGENLLSQVLCQNLKKKSIFCLNLLKVLIFQLKISEKSIRCQHFAVFKVK